MPDGSNPSIGIVGCTGKLRVRSRRAPVTLGLLGGKWWAQPVVTGQLSGQLTHGPRPGLGQACDVMALLRGSRQRRHQRMEEEEYGAGYEGEGAYEGEADQYTAMQVGEWSAGKHINLAKT